MRVKGENEKNKEYVDSCSMSGSFMTYNRFWVRF